MNTMGTERRLAPPVRRRRTVRSSKNAVAVASMALVLGCTGCVVNEPESPPRGIVVNGPPPPPVREERPAPPSPSAVWVNGYWHWTGMRYAWIPGHWDAPPPGAAWNAPVYTVRDGRYFYESGGWRPSAAPQRNALR